MAEPATVTRLVPRQTFAPGDFRAIRAEVPATFLDSPTHVAVSVPSAPMDVPLLISREHVVCRLDHDGWPRAWPIRSGEGAYGQRPLPDLTPAQAKAVAELRDALERYMATFPAREWWGTEGGVVRAHLLLQDVAYQRAV